MTPVPSSPRTEGWIARYEELRQPALGRPSGSPRGQGLALLMRGGMAGWMHAWVPCVVESAAPPNAPRDAGACVPIAMHREVTMILAGMVLSGRQEVIA